MWTIIGIKSNELLKPCWVVCLVEDLKYRPLHALVPSLKSVKLLYLPNMLLVLSIYKRENVNFIMYNAFIYPIGETTSTFHSKNTKRWSHPHNNSHEIGCCPALLWMSCAILLKVILNRVTIFIYKYAPGVP